MDTTTVLAIIKMIDAQLLHIARKHSANNLTFEAFLAASSELTKLGNHLQEYIEGQVSAMENSTEQ
jgi:hypothetical protein